MENQLTTIPEVTVLEKTQAQTILDNFTGFFEDAKKWEQTAKEIVVTDVTQTEQIQKARKVRLELKNIRVDAENTRKRLKEQGVREGKAIDGIANVIKALIVPLEEHLENQEKFVEMLAEKEKDAVNNKRIIELAPFVQDISVYNLREMSEAGFQELLRNSRGAVEAAQRAERIAEEKRLAELKEKEEQAEKDRIENEKLKAEAEAREKQIAKERAEAEKKEKEAQAKRDAEIAEAKAREQKEREAREKLQQELAQKRLDEQKAKDEQEAKLEAEAEEQEKAKRDAALAPDKDKLLKIAEQIRAIKLPQDLSKDAQILSDSIEPKLTDVARYIEKSVRELK